MFTLSIAVSPDEQSLGIFGLCSYVICDSFLVLDDVSSGSIRYAPTLLYELPSPQEHQRAVLVGKNATADNVC